MNEPVAFVDKIWIERPDLVMSHELDIGRLFMRTGEEIKNYIPLYTHPQKKLTDEEIIDLWRKFPNWGNEQHILMFAKELLKKAREHE
jgi:hypothetical protein